LAFTRNLLKCNSDFGFLLHKQQALLQQTVALIFPIATLAVVSINKLFLAQAGSPVNEYA